ncbi:MAG: SDR family oxidoreductase [Hyphomicrobiaceae bacterium]|nr:SDR family oxidoreductase [Hyphomicrobiaceae bacterium]
MSAAFTDGADAHYGDLKDRAVLITGGGSGIGAAIVEAFCGQGSRVAFLDVADAPSEALVARIGGGPQAPRYFHCDLKSPEAVADAVRQAEVAIGPIDVLINNAANDQRHTFESMSAEEWDGCIAINLKHQFLTAKAVLPGMRDRKRGTIVNMSSTSFMIGVGGMPAYTAAKAGIIGLTRSISRDFGPDGIRCNAIAPGWIMTERQLSLWLDEAGEKWLMENQSIKAKLYPEDIASVVLFMASRASGAITGQTIIADAGHL